MKKYICIILVFCLLLVFVGCAKEDNDLTKESEASSESGQTSPEKATGINSSTVIAEENTPKEEATVIKGDGGADSLSGLSPLEAVTYKASATPDGISLQKKSHSHGPASDGKAHYTVEEFQDTFDKYGALTLDRHSTEKVLYLTFDCGYEYENLTSRVLDTLKQKNVSAAFFCTLDHITSEPELISRMINEGHIVGNHSATHPSFAEISREEMAKEIEETENYLRENFGYAAKYFRFPAGEYTESALELVDSLGYMSVFWSVAYNDWNTDNIQGKEYAVETVLGRLHPGAVILLHSVSRDNAEALGEIIDRAREEGYVFRALTDYS